MGSECFSDLRIEAVVDLAGIYQFGALAPADNTPREHVNHSRHVKPAFRRPDIGKVGDPLLVRSRGLELAVQDVRWHGWHLAIR
jgi:hypothetical protein